MHSYPLTLNYDLWSVPHKMTVKDAQGSTYMQAVRSLTLKQQIEVTTYSQHQQQVYKVAAERLVATRPLYDIWNQQGQTIGTIQRQTPWWKCHYNIHDGKQLLFRIEEENPRILSAMLMLSGVGLSFLGMSSRIPPLQTMSTVLFAVMMVLLMAIGGGYVLNPVYVVQTADHRRVMRFAKIPSLSRLSQFSIQAIDTIGEAEESKALFGILLLVLQERSKT
jgi:hypothetical protein